MSDFNQPHQKMEGTNTTCPLPLLDNLCYKTSVEERVALGAEDIRIYEGILRAPSYTLTFTPERGGERIYEKEIIEQIEYACIYRSF